MHPNRVGSQESKAKGQSVKETFAAIRALGMAVSRKDGEWRVRPQHAGPGIGYYTEDNADAIATARHMTAIPGVSA